MFAYLRKFGLLGCCLAVSVFFYSCAMVAPHFLFGTPVSTVVERTLVFSPVSYLSGFALFGAVLALPKRNEPEEP